MALGAQTLDVLRLVVGQGMKPVLFGLIAGLAALKSAIPKSEMSRFIAERGIPGYAPTQGHIASAVCYLAHARAAMAWLA